MARAWNVTQGLVLCFVAFVLGCSKSTAGTPPQRSPTPADSSTAAANRRSGTLDDLVLASATDSDASKNWWCDIDPLPAFEYAETFPVAVVSLHHNDDHAQVCYEWSFGKDQSDTLTNYHFDKAALTFASVFPEVTGDSYTTDDLIIAMPAAPGTCITPEAGIPAKLGPTPYSSDAFAAFLAINGVTAPLTAFDLKSQLGAPGNTALILGSAWTLESVAEQLYSADAQSAEGHSYGVFTIRHVTRGTRVTFILATVDSTPGPNGDFQPRYGEIDELLGAAALTADDHPTFIAADINQPGDDPDGSSYQKQADSEIKMNLPLTLDVSCNTPQGLVSNQGGQIIQLVYKTGAGTARLKPMGNYLGPPPSGPTADPGVIVLPGVSADHPMVGVRLRYDTCISGVLCGDGCSNLRDNDDCGSCGNACTGNTQCNTQGVCVSTPPIRNCCKKGYIACGCTADCTTCQCAPASKGCGAGASPPVPGR